MSDNITAKEAADHLETWLCSALQDKVNLDDTQQLNGHFASWISNQLINSSELREISKVLYQ